LSDEGCAQSGSHICFPPKTIQIFGKSSGWYKGTDREQPLFSKVKIGDSTLSKDSGSRTVDTKVKKLVFRLHGVGFRFQGPRASGFRVQASGVRGQGSGARSQGSGVRGQGSGCRGQGSGIRG